MLAIAKNRFGGIAEERVLGSVAEDASKSVDCGEGGANFMAHVRQERALGLVSELRTLAGFDNDGVLSFEFISLLLERFLGGLQTATFAAKSVKLL